MALGRLIRSLGGKARETYRKYNEVIDVSDLQELSKFKEAKEWTDEDPVYEEKKRAFSEALSRRLKGDENAPVEQLREEFKEAWNKRVYRKLVEKGLKESYDQFLSKFPEGPANFRIAIGEINRRKSLGVIDEMQAQKERQELIKGVLDRNKVLVRNGQV